MKVKKSKKIVKSLPKTSHYRIKSLNAKFTHQKSRKQNIFNSFQKLKNHQQCCKPQLQYNNSLSQIQNEVSYLKRIYNQIELSFFQDIGNIQNLLQKLKKQVRKLQEIGQNIFNVNYYEQLWKIKQNQLDLLSFFQLIKIVQSSKCNLYTLRYKINNYILKEKTKGLPLNTPISVINITFQQLQMLNKRGFFMEYFQQQQEYFEQSSKFLQNVSPIKREIFILYRILTQINREIMKSLNILKLNIIKNTKIQQQNFMQLENKYVELLINKNLKLACQTTQQTFEINFFKFCQYNETLLYQKFNPIINYTQWKRFIEVRKPQKQGRSNYFLHTNCLSCFSSYYQQYNPFLYCQRCHKRFHKYCVNNPTSCDSCSYKYLSKSKKSQIKECFICGINGLMVTKITKNLYIHNFCMMIHGLWNIQQKKVTYSNKQINKVKKQVNFCFQCKKQGSFWYQCIHCNKIYHASCAYFIGCKINFDNQEVKINCCLEKRQNIGWNRKFNLNLQKMVYQQSTFEHIKQRYFNQKINQQ